MSHYFSLRQLVDHFTVMCVVAWPLNESETVVEFFFYRNLPAFISMMLFSCQLVGIDIRKAVIFQSKQDQLQPNFNSKARQLSKRAASKWSIERFRK